MSTEGWLEVMLGCRDSGVKLAMRDACEGCVCKRTGCIDGMADVQYISGGYDPGARPT